MKPISSPGRLALLSLALALGALWIWYSRVDPTAVTGGAIPAPRQGFLAPDFELQNTDGESVRLADLRGRPVLVNAWASWCTPCKAEMPALQRVYQDYQARGLEILAVNATSQDTPDAALALAQKTGLTFPVLLDPQGAFASLYQVQALPTSFFIDKNGLIQEVIVGGPMSEALLRVRLERLFETAAKEQP